MESDAEREEREGDEKYRIRGRGVVRQGSRRAAEKT